MWRNLALFSHLPIGAGFLICVLLFSILGIAIFKSTDSISPDNKHTDISPQHFYYSLICIVISLLVWIYWVYPSLNRPPDTYGDEDFHFQATQAIAHYLSAFFHGELPPTAAPTASRYGGLMYLLFGLFTPGHSYLSPFLQRLGLLVPFFLMSLITYISATQIIQNKFQAILFTSIICTSPLLLCFLTDKYLDIGHIPLFFMTFACLHWGITKQNIYAFTLAGLSASLLPLVRENAIPTTILISFFLLIYGTFIYPKKTQWSILIAASTLLPFILFYVFKIHTTSIDTERLSLKNALHQDYFIFFRYAAIYFNPVMIILALYGIFRSNKKEKIVIGLIFTSLICQLSLYALFQPGWMPWSRNYMMFYSQLVFLALLGTQYIRIKGFLTFSFILAILINCGLDTYQLNKNHFFHEIEIRYNYLKLFTYLSTTKEIPSNSKIYTQVPIALPYSFIYSQEKIPVSFSFNLVLKHHERASFANMMSFQAFTKNLPKEARFLLFHWWNPSTSMKILETYPKINKPSQSELAKYKILFENEDNLSNGKSGFILLRKINEI